MPGIAAVFSREPGANHEHTISLMLETMMHEPFYESGQSCAPEIGVWAGWVAHKASFAAHQSKTETGNVVTLAFAGECYQEDAASQQHRTGLPTLLSLYNPRGQNWIRELNGLFSGVLIDRAMARAYLFNDRFGVERVYIHESKDAIFVASEAKALLRVLPALRSFDDEGVADFLTFGCPLSGRTLFRGIRSLDAGSVWVFDGQELRKNRYFTPSEWEAQPTVTAEEFHVGFAERFKNALPRYLVSSSPIGISLTGGLDTRMIMACLPDATTRPVCYTFAGLNGRTLDARIAARVASQCHLEHDLVRVDRDFLSNYQEHVERTVYITDGAAGATKAHEIYLNTRARRLASVRMTGNFGSEVLRGMSTFKQIGLSRRLFREDFQPMLDSAAQRIPGAGQHPVTFAAFEEIPWNLYGAWVAAKSQLTVRTPYLDNDIVSFSYRAPLSLRRSAAPALMLVASARPQLAVIPTDRAIRTKGAGIGYPLRRAFAEFTFKLDYLYAEGLPTFLSPLENGVPSLQRIGLLGLHKYLPYRAWFGRELSDFVHERLTDPMTARVPYWTRTQLALMAEEHRRGRTNLVREIDAVVTLSAIDRNLLRNDTFVSSGADPVVELRALPNVHSERAT